MSDNIDYKKLLEICMASWFESEGVCWDGSFNDDLTEEEKKAVLEVHEKAREKWLSSLLEKL